MLVDTTIRQQLADALRSLLEERSESDTEIAELLGMSKQRLSHLKHGNKHASPEAIERAINALGYRVVGVKIEKL